MTASPAVDPVLDTVRRLRRAGAAPARPGAPAPPPIAPWLDQRWGPALTDSTPSVIIPPDGWRWTVANWPIGPWLTWRRRVDALLVKGGGRPTVEAIHAAEHLAFLEVFDSEGRR